MLMLASAFFLVSSNDPISLQPILANSYTELQNPNSYVFANGSAFYVGLYTGNQTYAPPSGIYSDPLFGWAWLWNNNGVIQMIDGAIAYKAPGIYAGTLNLIPEPTTVWLLALGVSLLGRRLLRRRK